jgi:nitrogen fixation NifU-like protein
VSLGEELYRDIILEHANNPSRRGSLPTFTHSHVGLNPLCGDEIELQLLVEDGIIRDIRFRGDGCSISQASASMLTQEVVGKSLEEVGQLTETFKDWMKDRAKPEPDGPIGDLEALAGVRSYPVRIKCALLPWTTMHEALKGEGEAS